MNVWEYLEFTSQVRGLDEGTFRSRLKKVVEVGGKIIKTVIDIGKKGSDQLHRRFGKLELESQLAAHPWPELDWDELEVHHGLQKWVFDERVPPESFATFEQWRQATQVYQAELIKHHVELLRPLAATYALHFAQDRLREGGRCLLGARVGAQGFGVLGGARDLHGAIGAARGEAGFAGALGSAARDRAAWETHRKRLRFDVREGLPQLRRSWLIPQVTLMTKASRRCGVFAM